uniref:Olfactory receptor n=1 Tax=Geotrypetes seraphini TaxID=260995 RepID=A0A6P8NS90_GEOSA|nr:olfactory receptor 1020-like [Geotrypetes seraphini]
MWSANQTKLKEFILNGLSNNEDIKPLLFAFFFIVYALTLFGNITIIMLVWSNSSLHKPMYFFLGNLSFVEIGYTSSTVPKMLSGFLSKTNSISFRGCFVQLFFFFIFGIVDCFLLTVMGYDRYLAICQPLHYHMLMCKRVCFRLVSICWAIGFFSTVVPIILVSQQPFCDNKINHFLCDTGPLLALSCVSNFTTQMTILVLTSLVLIVPFCFICVSYVFITRTILKIPSASGRYKAFSTCASHISVVTMFFGCAIYIYVRPTGNHPFLQDKLMAVFYNVLTPLFNPIIYTLRNKEFIKAVKKNHEVLIQWKVWYSG